MDINFPLQKDFPNNRVYKGLVSLNNQLEAHRISKTGGEHLTFSPCMSCLMPWRMYIVTGEGASYYLILWENVKIKNVFL